jgi:hypothetical protein
MYLPSMTIALTGPHGIGKDTVCKLIQQAATKNTLPPYRLAFADPVKKAAQSAFGLTDDWLEDAAKSTVHPTWGITPRQMYQQTADIYQTAYGADFWVRTAKSTYDYLHDDGSDIAREPVIVITDLTDPIGEVESDWIRSLPNSFIVHMQGPLRGRAAGDGGKHRSTRGVVQKPGDLVLRNEGSIDTLAIHVGLLLASLVRITEKEHA